MVNGWPQPSGSVDFPGRNAGEHLQFYFRHHWVRVAGALLRTFCFTLGIAVLGLLAFPPSPADRGGTWHALLLCLQGSFFVAHVEFLVRFYAHFLRLVIVSDQGIHRIRKTLLAFDDHEVIDLASLQDVHKSQRGVVQNVLGYGTLMLEAQQTTARIHYTPSIARTHRWVMELRDQARRRSMDSSSRDRSPYEHADSSR